MNPVLFTVDCEVTTGDKFEIKQSQRKGQKSLIMWQLAGGGGSDRNQFAEPPPHGEKE